FRLSIHPHDITDAVVSDLLGDDVFFHERLQIGGTQRRGAGFKPGKQGIDELLLGNDANAAGAATDPLADTAHEFFTGLVGAALTAPENDNGLVGLDSGLALPELV